MLLVGYAELSTIDDGPAAILILASSTAILAPTTALFFTSAISVNRQSARFIISMTDLCPYLLALRLSPFVISPILFNRNGVSSLPCIPMFLRKWVLV